MQGMSCFKRSRLTVLISGQRVVRSFSNQIYHYKLALKLILIAVRLFFGLCSPIDTHLPAKAQLAAAMIQHIHGTLRKIDVRRRVQMPEYILRQLLIVGNGRPFIGDDEDLVEHHLAGSPHGIHHLLSLSCVFFMDLGDHEVVEHAFDRHIHIDYLRHHCHFHRSQEDPFGSLSQPGILLWWDTDDRRRVDCLFPVCDGGDMKAGIPVRAVSSNRYDLQRGLPRSALPWGRHILR